MTIVSELTEEMDKFMEQITHQSVVDSGRVLDFVLDLRQIVNRKEAIADDN